MPRKNVAREDREDRRALYKRQVEDAFGRHYAVSDFALHFFCNRQKDMLACAELDRREKLARAVGKPLGVAREIELTTRQRNKQRLADEVEKILAMSPYKKKKLLAEYRKEHPRGRFPSIPEVAEDQLVKYDRKHTRKRWKRISKSKEPEPASPPTRRWMYTDSNRPDPHRKPINWSEVDWGRPRV